MGMQDNRRGAGVAAWSLITEFQSSPSPSTRCSPAGEPAPAHPGAVPGGGALTIFGGSVLN